MLNKNTNIVLSPHFDDAVFSSFSVLDSGDNTKLITIFTGFPDKNRFSLWDFLCTGKRPKETMKLRNIENDEVIKKLGLDSINLDFVDNQYKVDVETDVLKNQLTKLSNKTTSTIYAPLAMSESYIHPDHRLVRNICIDFLRDGYNVIFYADLPYMNTSKQSFNNELAQLKSLSGTDFKFDIKFLQKKQSIEKFKTMRIYKSQFFMTNLTSLGRLSNPKYFTNEVYFSPEENK